MNLGPTELIIVLLIVLLIFGGAKLPKLARSMGQASKEFKQGLTEGAPDDGDEPAADGGKGSKSAKSAKAAKADPAADDTADS
jgi:sec-independent protein translocase protein TatA